MENAEFEHTLRVGLGRAVVYLRAVGGGARYRERVLRACRRNMVYDRQIEEWRGQFLFDVIAATGEPGFYRRWLLRATAPWRVRGAGGEQLLALLRVFATAGDGEARARLYRICAANAATDRPNGAAEIVELDGLAGLLFVAPRLVIDAEDAWFARSLIWEASERARRGSGAGADDDAALDYPAIRAWLLAGEGRGRGLLWRWARGATDEELVTVATDLLAENEPQRLNVYLRVFARRRFPLDHKPLLALARNPSPRIAGPVVGALANIEHDDVRALALKLLAAGRGRGAQLLAANYREGDFALVERLLRSWEDRAELHSLGFGLRDMAEVHPAIEVRGALLALYERGPCSLCRRRTVELLAGLGPLPEWLIAECRWDANPAIRGMMEGHEHTVSGFMGAASPA